MDPVSIIVMALATGAAAGLEPVAKRAVKDAYNGIKRLIERKYGQVNIDKMEANPSSEELQNNLKEELEKTDAGKDDELLNQTKAMLDAIHDYDPEAARTIGFNLSIVREAMALNIELQGLYNIREMQTQNLIHQETERAKYGGVGVPLRLMHSINDTKREINRIDARISELKNLLNDYSARARLP